MFSFLSTAAKKPACLVPTLRDAANKKKRHYLTELCPGDQLQTTSKLLGFPKGARLPIYGFGAEYDAQGLVALRAYVRPLSPQQSGARPYAERDFARRPVDYQREQWFGTYLMYLVEIDLMDHADCLRLERLSERVMPLLPAATLIGYRQAA